MYEQFFILPYSDRARAETERLEVAIKLAKKRKRPENRLRPSNRGTRAHIVGSYIRRCSFS